MVVDQIILTGDKYDIYHEISMTKYIINNYGYECFVKALTDQKFDNYRLIISCNNDTFDIELNCSMNVILNYNEKIPQKLINKYIRTVSNWLPNKIILYPLSQSLLQCCLDNLLKISELSKLISINFKRLLNYCEIISSDPTNKLHEWEFMIKIINNINEPWINKYRSNLIELGLCDKFIKNITELEFNNMLDDDVINDNNINKIITNKYLKLTKDNCRKIMKNLQEKKYTKVNTNIAVHIVDIYGFDYEMCKYFLGNFNFIKIIYDKYPKIKKKILNYLMSDKIVNIKIITNIFFLLSKNEILLSPHIVNKILLLLGPKTHNIEHEKDLHKYLKKKKIFFNKYNCIYTYSFVCNLGFTPNQETLEIISFWTRNDIGIQIFEDIIDTNNVKVSKRCIINFLNNKCKSNYLLQKILNTKPEIDDEIINVALENNLIQFVNTFKNYNNEMINNNLILSIKNHVINNDFNNKGIGCDEIYFYCHIYNFYPSIYISYFKEHIPMFKLRELFRTSRLDKIKTYLQNNKDINPDYYCINNSILNSDISVIEYIIEKKLKYSNNVLYLLKFIPVNRHKKINFFYNYYVDNLELFDDANKMQEQQIIL